MDTNDAPVDNQYLPMNGNAKLIRNAVNVFGNTPFAQAGDYREYLDLDQSSFVEDFDRDVDIVSFIIMDDASSDDFETYYFTWDFDYEGRNDYWCQQGFCADADSEGSRSAVAGRRSERN